MAAAVRRPHRAELGALVDGVHRRLTAIASSEESLFQTASSEERRVSETLMTGLHCHGMHDDPEEDVQVVEELLSSNALSERGPHERQTHVTATGQEPRGFMMEGPCKLGNMLDDSPIHDSCGMHDQVELLCSNAPSECRPHALLIGATATSKETRAPETLCSNNALVDSHPQAQLTDAALVAVDGVLQTQYPRAVAPTITEEVGILETLIPGQHTMLFSSSSAGSKFSKVEDGQNNDSDVNDSMVIPIFVRHVSGELTFTVGMDQSTGHLMQLYAQRTKTILDSQYFVYERKRLEPHHTWFSYGIKRDTTVHVCTGLLGGADHPNLQDYINNNKQKFVKVVSLPDGGASLQMTKLGCQFLSSWIRCLTAAFNLGKSWNGKFELVDFKFVEVEGHVRPIKKSRKHINPSSVCADIHKFADLVESILQFSDMPNVVSKHPPYVQSCMKMLRELVGRGIPGPLTVVTGPLSNNYKILLDTLVCCMTSKARERLIIELFRKYEGANNDETVIWENAINHASCPDTWRTMLSNDTIFGHFIEKADNDNKPYPLAKTGAFTLLKNVVMHAADSSKENPNAPTLGDGIELMIPANKHLKEFLPYIIKNLIENNVDISKELSAAIQCACNICDSSH